MNELIAQCELVASTAKIAVPELKAFETVEEAVSIPAIVVQPAEPFITYHQRFGSKEAHYQFDIVLLVSKVNSRAAQRTLYSLIEPSGALFTALDALPGWDIEQALNVGYYSVGNAAYWGGSLGSTYDG